MLWVLDRVFGKNGVEWIDASALFHATALLVGVMPMLSLTIIKTKRAQRPASCFSLMEQDAFASAYLEEENRAAMAKVLEPVTVSALEDIVPEMIIVIRRFDERGGVGVSGHDDHNALHILERNRDLPRAEGFGMSKIAFSEPKGVRYFFFQALNY